MLAENHRQKAEEIEQDIFSSQQGRSPSLLIEGAWGAAFHWIAFGCETKHQCHQESHARLGSFLRNQGDEVAATWWESIDNLRQGGWYGSKIKPSAVQDAFQFLEKVRT